MRARRTEQEHDPHRHHAGGTTLIVCNDFDLPGANTRGAPVPTDGRPGERNPLPSAPGRRQVVMPYLHEHSRNEPAERVPRNRHHPG